MPDSYTPYPKNTSGVEFPETLKPLREGIAKQVHEVWAEARRAEGKKPYNDCTEAEKQDGNSTNPYLMPFEELTEAKKESNYLTSEETIKLIMACGYEIIPPDEAKAKKKQESLFKRWFKRWFNRSKNKKIRTSLSEIEKGILQDGDTVEYRVPLIIGLVGAANCDNYDFRKLCAAFDNLVATELIKSAKQRRVANSSRTTPVYLLSGFDTELERKISQYAKDKYDIGLLQVVNDGGVDEYGKAVSLPNCGSPEARAEYIRYCSYAMLSLWDGIVRESHPLEERVVRCALTGTPVTAASNVSASSAKVDEISRKLPVFQIILPNERNEYQEYYYKLRRLLPHVLESGVSWFYLNRFTEELVLVNKNGKEAPALRAVALRGKREHLVRSSISKSIRKRRKLADEWAKNTNDAYLTRIELEKLERYETNFNFLCAANKSLRKCKDKKRFELFRLKLPVAEPAGDSFIASRFAYARFARYDVCSTYLQNSHKSSVRLIACLYLLAFIGYGVFTDMATPHSLLGMAGGALFVLFIILYLIGVLLNKKSSRHGGHVALRIMGETQRIQTYWNLSGLSSDVNNPAYECYDIANYYGERYKQNVEWMQSASRGWLVLDTAATDGKNLLRPDDVNAKAIMDCWIGTNDTADDDTVQRYKPSGSDTQLGYNRKKYAIQSEAAIKESIIRERYLPYGVFILSIIAFCIVLGLQVFRAGSLPSEYLSDSYDFGFANLIEAFTIFIVGLLPAFSNFISMYSEIRQHQVESERKLRLATQYQHLVSKVSNDSSDEAKKLNRRLVQKAGELAAQDVAEWFTLFVDCDIKPTV